jgi:hypothetical protein
MVYNFYMIELLFILGFMTVGIGYFALQQEKEYKLMRMIEDGYNPNARDGDKDGIVQEGTKWERKL